MRKKTSLGLLGKLHVHLSRQMGLSRWSLNHSTVLNELSRGEGDIPGGHWFRRRRVGGCKGASGHFHHIDIPAPLAGPRAAPRTHRLPFAARHPNRSLPPDCLPPPGHGIASTTVQYFDNCNISRHPPVSP